jgi:phosphonate transport system substrate-binding protein
LLAAVFMRVSQAAAPASSLFRLGFSHSLFTDVNENDAEAAVKVWGQTIAKERGISTETASHIFQDTPELLKALQSKSVDAVGISMVEYAELSQAVRFNPIFVTYNSGRTREQYLLLVHRDSKLERLADLRGRSLVFHLNSRACLAQPWLDTLLLQEDGLPAAGWFGKITRSPKLAQVILPVFFHRIDVCVATRTEYETMCELNPQIGQQLKILARSPEVVASAFCFRADYAPAFKEQLFVALRDLHKSPAGLQVLTLFQSERIEDQPASCLDSALGLLAQQAQLTDRFGASNSLSQAGAPQTLGVHP